MFFILELISKINFLNSDKSDSNNNFPLYVMLTMPSISNTSILKSLDIFLSTRIILSLSPSDTSNFSFNSTHAKYTL